MPTLLRFLVTQDRIFLGPESARAVLDWLRSLHFDDDEPGSARTPVEVVDYDGNPISLAVLTPTA